MCQEHVEIQQKHSNLHPEIDFDEPVGKEVDH